MIIMDQGYKAKIDMRLEEDDEVSILFREKLGGIKLAWDGDIPVLRVFLTDNDEPDGFFRFVNETTEEAKTYLKKYGQ